MGSAEKVSWKRVLILAGAIPCIYNWTGFATGQEIHSILYSIWSKKDYL